MEFFFRQQGARDLIREMRAFPLGNFQFTDFVPVDSFIHAIQRKGTSSSYVALCRELRVLRNEMDAVSVQPDDDDFENDDGEGEEELDGSREEEEDGEGEEDDDEDSKKELEETKPVIVSSPSARVTRRQAAAGAAGSPPSSKSTSKKPKRPVIDPEELLMVNGVSVLLRSFYRFLFLILLLVYPMCSFEDNPVLPTPLEGSRWYSLYPM